jgi:hypothetical protein
MKQWGTCYTMQQPLKEVVRDVLQSVASFLQGANDLIQSVATFEAVLRDFIQSVVTSDEVLRDLLHYVTTYKRGRNLWFGGLSPLIRNLSVQRSVPIVGIYRFRGLSPFFKNPLTVRKKLVYSYIHTSKESAMYIV